ncbi:hypothetical protein O0I10_001694 [Lichtheimia ornata]|uniref:Uncharacterized protein n=1 Tax=Lichtheimia ornata TaxID=688661 RepID=A0AAD7VCR9_9FUNG|nr:uncharacterized protein O0I10_001694 [Lichtheimia ornata]KAJ8662730.1 hypothetical protein O0I10_001694 [Lichtheimia ornata]
MQQDHYPKVAAAIQYLSEHAIPGITILGHHHSDHCYGQIHHSARQDRINVRFQYYGQIVDGQVIFDSSDYAFAPDILFDPNAPLISNDDARLLPIAWHIGDSACLHDWLQFVRQKIFNIPPEINTQQDTTSDDLMEVDGEKRSPHLDETTSASVVVNETEAKTSTVAAEEADMVVDLPEVRQEPIPISSPSPPEPAPKVTRKAFIEHWVKEMPNHVIRYDTDSIVLYLTVKIPPSIWEEMQPYHRQSVDALAGCAVKISKPRDTAPCLVQLTMPEQFPQVIQVTLISAINVDPHHDEIYWPDRTGFVIDDMDPTFTVKQMDTHIRRILTEEIPMFHSGLFRDEDTQAVGVK